MPKREPIEVVRYYEEHPDNRRKCLRALGYLLRRPTPMPPPSPPYAPSALAVDALETRRRNAKVKPVVQEPPSTAAPEDQQISTLAAVRLVQLRANAEWEKIPEEIRQRIEAKVRDLLPPE